MVAVSFLGLWTSEFERMRSLYAEGFNLDVLHEAEGVAWFGLDDGAELHLYAETDDYHSFFGAGPVPGLYVNDYDQALERLAGHKVEWLTETDTAKGRQWRHYRAPDGNVYEVMGPIDPNSSVRV